MGLRTGLLDLLFPRKCVFCRRVLSTQEAIYCPGCRQQLLGQEAIRAGRSFDVCYVALGYQGQVREAIQRFKFQDCPGYAQGFGEILAETLRGHLMGQYDLITWVPVSQERRRKRGYDQAQLLAQATAAALGETAISTLEKVHNISAQSSLQDAKERWRNVRGVYRVPDKTLVVGKRVVLVDDIITTGATMEEASRTLKAAGATLVLGLALTQPYDSNDSCEVSL